MERYEIADSLDQKAIDILCGLIAFPKQRVVYQGRDEHGGPHVFPRSSHSTVPLSGIRRAFEKLSKNRLVVVDKNQSDEWQIEYRPSVLGRSIASDYFGPRLSIHRKIARDERRKLKRRIAEGSVVRNTVEM